MTLHRLLPISRSFASQPGRAGRYRPAGEGMLPDFSVQIETRRAGGLLNRLPGMPATEGPTGPFQIPAVPVTGARRVGRREPRGWRLPVWVEQLVLAFLRPGNRRRGNRAVQGELTFQTVKVARNDLVTSDVEVVLVPSAKAATGLSATGLSAACRSRLLRLWWEQGAQRLRRLGGSLR